MNTMRILLAAALAAALSGCADPATMLASGLKGYCQSTSNYCGSTRPDPSRPQTLNGVPSARDR